MSEPGAVFFFFLFYCCCRRADYLTPRVRNGIFIMCCVRAIKPKRINSIARANTHRHTYRAENYLLMFIFRLAKNNSHRLLHASRSLTHLRTRYGISSSFQRSYKLTANSKSILLNAHITQNKQVYHCKAAANLIQCLTFCVK